MVNEEEQRAEITRTTYDYLRWLLILIPALLFVVTIVTALQQGELERSISAYYGGPVRDIFVGTLFAIAACLIAYQGVGLLEDYALNGAGVYAVFVALVPTGFAGLMNELRQTRSPAGLSLPTMSGSSELRSRPCSRCAWRWSFGRPRRQP